MDNKNLSQLSITDLQDLKIAICAEIDSRDVNHVLPLNLQNLINDKITFDGNYYNGGWIKTVSELDKTVANGYSIVGDFKQKSGINIYKNGLYLFCSINGSRKNQVKNYALIKLESGEVTVLQETSGRDWAVNLWKSIENNL